MDKVIKHLKSIGYIPIDYSTKIKNQEDYFKMVYKMIDVKYEKYVLIVNLQNVSEKICLFMKNRIKCQLDGNEVYVLFNKDNYLFKGNIAELHNNIINDFIGIKLCEKFNCCICLKDDFMRINNCFRCSASCCDDCIIKSIICKDGTDGVKDVKCVLCGNINGTLTIK